MSEAPAAQPYTAEQVDSLITLNRALVTQHLLRGLAHELRNNLQIVTLGASLDNESRGSAIAHKVDRALDDMVATLDLMSKLGRSTADEAPDARLDLAMDEVTRLADLQRNLPTLRLAVNPPAEPVRVAIRRTELIQILLNLIANAKEAQTRPTERVTVSTTIPMDGRIAILVDDTGAGLGADAGQPFESDRDRSLHGGIGLFCVRALAERAGGELGWEPRPEGGTRVRVVLPLSDPS